MTSNRLFRYGAALILAHAALTVVHGAAHAGEGVWPSPAEDVFVALVIAVAPLVALVLLFNHRPRAGAACLFGAMLGALLFGLANHYLLPGADNVASVPAGTWQLPFQVSSALLAVTEAAGTALGVWMLAAASRGTWATGALHG
jgi:hypothetical protein